MFQLIEFLKKRPSDLSIRIIRVLFSLGIAALLILARADYTLPFQSHYESFALIVKYVLAALFVVHAIVFGFLRLCVTKRATMKKLQMLSGVLMLVLGNLMGTALAPHESATSTQHGPVSISNLDQATVQPRNPINVGFYFALLGLLPLIAGISGKMITSSCLRYGEKIVKIRV